MTFNSLEEEISAMLDVADEDLTEEQRALMSEYLDELGSQEQDKIDAFAQFVRMESARADALKAEANRLAARAKTAQNRLDFLRMRYLQAMQVAGLQKVRGQVYSMSVRTTDVVQITDEQALPQEYVTQKITTAPDKVALKDALKSGAVVPGAQLAKSYSLRVA
jgi:hypothetical protein